MHHGFSVSSPEGYRDPIRLLIDRCRPGPVHLNGPMGAGKTTFTAMFFKELGVRDAVSSPTFSLIQEYLGNEGRRLVHNRFWFTTSSGSRLVPVHTSSGSQKFQFSRS